MSVSCAHCGLSQIENHNNHKTLNTSQLPAFYTNLSKVWNEFTIQKCHCTELRDNTGHFLNGDNPLFLYEKTSDKMFYKVCVKILNQKEFNPKLDTPWHTVLGVGNEAKPEWRAQYTPPLAKRAGDLQWRI